MDRFMKFKKIKNLNESFRKLERYFKNLLNILSDIREDLDQSRDVDYNIALYIDNLRDVIRDCNEYLDLPVYEDSELTTSDVRGLKERIDRVKYWFGEMNNYKGNHLATNEERVKDGINEFEEALGKCPLDIRNFEDKMG